MGEVADTMTKKKKKGRPSLLDLQKRALKQQQLQQQQHKNQDDLVEDHRSGSKNPNSFNQPPNYARRSKRRDSNPNGVSSDSAWIKDDEEVDDAHRGGDEDDDERREKKHRLLHGLNSHSHRHSPNSQSGGSDLNPEEASETPEASVNRRKISGGARGSDYTGEKASKATDILQGSPVESGPTTPLPDKKLLVFILDRLQKKDTYGVYSDPVDPEELPDYHEIIKNPMDFSTVRKKLESEAYANLEQFERDVFLICTNAMEYNSADTVYYKQARGILELAKKDFENLRRDSDDEEPQQQQQQQQLQPKVVKRGRPPKKQPDPSSIDRTASEISADGLTPGGDNSRLAGVYNLRKAPPSYKYRPAETSVRVNHNSETQSGFSVDWENEFPPSVVKAVNKYGMKHFNVDDNRRDTYNHLSTSLHEPSVLTTLEDELKQLIPVGLNTEYGYARSMARYAANLGPVAWKMASRKIENVIPSGIKFGPGWVGDNPTPEEDNTQQPNLGKQKCSNDLASDDHSNRILSPTTSVSSAFIGNRHSSHGIEETTPGRVLNQETEFVAGQSINHPSSSSSSRQIHHPGPLISPESNGLIRGFSGFSHSPNPMLGISRQLQHSNEQQGLFPYSKQEFHRFPPDLNARLVSPNSPGSNPQTGSSSSQHPDLALQL